MSKAIAHMVRISLAWIDRGLCWMIDVHLDYAIIPEELHWIQQKVVHAYNFLFGDNGAWIDYYEYEHWPQWSR